ncbi:MAG: antibiotic biosynthesis monooxygenase, partial [Rikenellaceae bacterium]
LSEVIWSFEGRITDKAMFREACEKLTPITQAEDGSILYLWCVDEDDHFFVLERYIDSEAAMIHMKNSAEGGKLFFGSTEVTAFTIYSEISPELSDVVNGLNPEMMEFVAGFSR